MIYSREESIAWAEYLRGFLRQAKRDGWIADARASLARNRIGRGLG